MSQVSVRSELSVTKMPSLANMEGISCASQEQPIKSAEQIEQEQNLKDLLNPIADLKSRSYYIELVYEKWDFTDNQSKYIDMLRSNNLLENKVYDKDMRKGSANSKAGTGKAAGKSGDKKSSEKKSKNSSIPMTQSQTEAISNLE